MGTDQSVSETDRFDAFCQSLRMNINAALSVAGPERDDGRTSGLRDSHIHRQTGIARSTLRALRKGGKEQAPIPDLRTLTKLAELIGVPVAFLLMSPKDWDMLVKAVGVFPQMLSPTDDVLRDRFGDHKTVRQVLERMGMFKTDRPRYAEIPPEYKARLDKEDERRRRISHTLGALMLLGQPAHEKAHYAQHLAHIALAASIVNQTRPTDE